MLLFVPMIQHFTMWAGLQIRQKFYSSQTTKPKNNQYTP